MHTVQDEVKAAKPDLNVEILGVNLINRSSSNPLIVAGRTLPWLQDTAAEDVWKRWEVVYRDVRILDSENRVRAVYNLTEHDLAQAANRAALKQLFLEAARAVDSDNDHLPDDWEQRYWGGLSVGAGGDPDHDGADNFTEFSLGTDPTDPNSASSMQPGVAVKDGQRVLTVTFLRRAGDMLDYFLEASGDLTQWAGGTANVTMIQGPRNFFDGWGTAEVVCALTRPLDEAAWGFLRVRAVPRVSQP